MKILMVCLGNICRSPLAHGMMEKLVKDRNLDWEIDSAGTGDWHIGKGPDYRSVAVANRYNIDISGQICRKVSSQDFDIYDRIYVMDHSNFEDMCNLVTEGRYRKKVRLLLEDEIVPDPYWDDHQFETVFHLIREGCEKILETEIKNQF